MTKMFNHLVDPDVQFNIRQFVFNKPLESLLISSFIFNLLNWFSYRSLFISYLVLTIYCFAMDYRERVFEYFFTTISEFMIQERNKIVMSPFMKERDIDDDVIEGSDFNRDEVEQKHNEESEKRESEHEENEERESEHEENHESEEESEHEENHESEEESENEENHENKEENENEDDAEDDAEGDAEGDIGERLIEEYYDDKDWGDYYVESTTTGGW